MIHSLAADGRNVVWQSTSGKSARQIWTAPLAGGRARLVTELTGDRADLDAISVNGDQVIWSERSGGVWRVPLAGGTPDRIAATDGLHLLRWPWASDAPAGPISATATRRCWSTSPSSPPTRSTAGRARRGALRPALVPRPRRRRRLPPADRRK
ncbi:TolB family protein [Nonomuraea thailandensis]